MFVLGLLTNLLILVNGGKADFSSLASCDLPLPDHCKGWKPTETTGTSGLSVSLQTHLAAFQGCHTHHRLVHSLLGMLLPCRIWKSGFWPCHADV